MVSCGWPLRHGTTEGSVLEGARGRDSLRRTASGGGDLSASSVSMWGPMCDKPSPRAGAALLTLKHFDPLGVA